MLHPLAEACDHGISLDLAGRKRIWPARPSYGDVEPATCHEPDPDVIPGWVGRIAWRLRRPFPTTVGRLFVLS